MNGCSMMRALLVGEAPGKKADPSRPLIGGLVGKRLMDLLGFNLGLYVRRVDRVNVLDYFPGRTGKGDSFPMAEARQAADRLKTALFCSKDRVVLLGRRVAAAFKVKAEYLEWVEVGNTKVAVLPHPSGINRWWNDPVNKSRATRFMRELGRLIS